MKTTLLILLLSCPLLFIGCDQPSELQNKEAQLDESLDNLHKEFKAQNFWLEAENNWLSCVAKKDQDGMAHWQKEMDYWDSKVRFYGTNGISK